MTRTGGALCGVDEIGGRTFDYVVVGGGTAGLAVAARLTENPDVRVAVLEAGADRMDDKQISTPSLYPTLIGREKYDWCYNSIAQVRYTEECGAESDPNNCILPKLLE
jgi:choline dehydrogenase-like flavoprotein